MNNTRTLASTERPAPDFLEIRSLTSVFLSRSALKSSTTILSADIIERKCQVTLDLLEVVQEDLTQVQALKIKNQRKEALD